LTPTVIEPMELVDDVDTRQTPSQHTVLLYYIDSHRSPMLSAGSVSGRSQRNWWWCHDISYPLLAAEHSLCNAPWSGTPCRTTSVHSRTMSPLDSTWKP